MHFFRNEWLALESKLYSQACLMRTTEDPIYINPHLVFHHHGSSEYEAKLGSRLLFKARIDSKDPVHDRIHVWLEMLEGGGSLELPPRVTSWPPSETDIKGRRVSGLWQSRHAPRPVCTLPPS